MNLIYAVVEENGKKTRKIVLLPERRCEVCGAGFDPKTQTSKYCSRECSKKASYDRSSEKSRERSRKWYANNLERAKARRKKKYWSDPEAARRMAREYRQKNKDACSERDRQYKNKTRHGSNREQLIAENGLICSVCGEEGSRFQIVAHHTTFDKTNHSDEALFCRSCHAKEHNRHRKPSKIVCPVCQKVFESVGTTAKYCSRKCSRKKG